VGGDSATGAGAAIRAGVGVSEATGVGVEVLKHFGRNNSSSVACIWMT